MEKLTKRIIAIVLIAGLVTGIGVGVWFLVLPTEGVWKTPGVSGVDEEHMIKVGCMGDIGEIQGDGNYQGAYLAAKQINEAGGFIVNGTTYYVAVGKEDTDESAAEFSTSRAVTAAERMIYKHECDYAIGGFRSEALFAYREPFMENKILFLDTGAATDSFCGDVRDDYDHYKYFFRFSPTNSTSLGGDILYYLLGLIGMLNATWAPQGHPIDKIGYLVEDLVWTDGICNMIEYYFNGAIYPVGTLPVETRIKYDVTLTAVDMNAHLAGLEAEGVDLVITAISAQGGILMMQQYHAEEREFLIAGSDVQGQASAYWEDTNGACEYEIIMQTGLDVNKTPTTIPFWNAYNEEWGMHPLYMSFGAYDALNAIVDAIVAQQSFDEDDIIAEMETWTTDNPHPGAGGGGAWWPSMHELVAGFPWGYALWTQWQADGTKVVLQNYGPGTYGDNVQPLGTLSYPPWVTAAWSP